MESKQQTPSVILKLMGLDKVSTQHPIRDKQKVLSENYLQKVSSIGVRKKRSSHQQHYSFGMNTNNEKDESEDVLKVVKALRRGEHHNPSKGNGKETPSSCKNSHLPEGMLQEIVYPKSMKVYPEMREKKKISHHMHSGKQSSRLFSKVSEEISMESGNIANRVLDTGSSLFFRWNVSFSNDMMKPTSNVSVKEKQIQCSSPFFSSDGSYVGTEARSKTSEQSFVTEKLQEPGQCSQDCTHNQLPMISERGNGSRNLIHRSVCSNDKIKRNIRCKVGFNFSFARKEPKPLCAASKCRTMNQDILFQRYWGLRRNASANCSSWKSKNHNFDQKEHLEDVNISPGNEKSAFFSSYFNGNDTEDNCIAHPSEKRCYGNDLSDKITMPPQLSSSSSTPFLIDEQIMQEGCLMNEVKSTMYEDSNMFKQNVVSPDCTFEYLVSDAMIEVVSMTRYPTKHQSESAAFILSQEIDSFNCTSHASEQQDISDFQENSVHSLCSDADSDSLGSFEEAHEPSPVSVLDPLFGEDIGFSSKCDNHVYEYSEEDDEEYSLNVSSDEDCENESVVDSEEKKAIAGLFRAEESRDFSYVVEVLTEAGICNRNLFTDFCTWHSAESPISPSVFLILEKKFGEQQLWKRSERKLLFDRINLGLLQILQPYLYIPIWEKSMSRRLNAEPSQNVIEEEMWSLLVAQEKKASKELADNMLGREIRWIEIVDDVEDIVREIVKLLTEELANEIISLESF
ncbi:hypothetical protein VNO78_14777 [Psophocarpus tetragonolobus]|uniref:DUF4378 domain-containing protein n=1 Tax=Psophocarpus tetragonolobus TaxID=3891 RepID=A0AAN9SF75_PSOTE